MKSIVVSLLFIGLAASSHAQFIIATDNVSGIPINARSLENNPNTPYLFNETYKGKVILADGKVMEGLNVLYDLRADAPMFVNAEGQFLKFNEIPLAFEMGDSENKILQFKKGFPVVEKYNANSFYQVLVEGKVQLLKKYAKGVTEAIPYGGVKAQITSIILASYYIYDGMVIEKIKKDPKALIAKLQSKADLTTILKQNKTDNNELLFIALILEHNASLQ